MQIVSPTPSAMYTGIANAVARISSTEGARSLWRGITSVALGAGMYFPKGVGLGCSRMLSGPAHAVYFGTYEFVKQKLGGNEGTEHHPIAVGEDSSLITLPFKQLYLNLWIL